MPYEARNAASPWNRLIAVPFPERSVPLFIHLRQEDGF